jgi:hypothetical protein
MRTEDGAYIEGGIVIATDEAAHDALVNAAALYGFSVDEFDVMTAEESIQRMADYSAEDDQDYDDDEDDACADCARSNGPGSPCTCDDGEHNDR